MTKMNIAKIAGLVLVLVVGLGVMARACHWCGEAADVAHEEMGPRAMLKKYTWFKDAAQQLQASQANIQVSEASLAAAKKEYEGTQLPRDVREAWAQQSAEIRGLKAAFNSLAAEYNANVRKVHWSVMNTENLPSEFTQYVIN